MSEVVEAAAERLYGLMPARIRLLDVQRGSPLFAFLRALAAGTVEVDGEINRLYDSLFVETADDAGLLAIGALIAAEPLKAPPGAPSGWDRGFIADTVRYRRAKGTARALEGLAGDVTDAGAMVVEYFQRLARLANLLDVRPERPALATLVDGDIGGRTGTAADCTPRLADLRSIARAHGRHGVTNVGVHVARLSAPEFPAPVGVAVSQLDMAGVPLLVPWRDGAHTPAGYFQLAVRPGGVQPLVNPDRRSANAGRRLDQTQMVDRLRRLPLCREAEMRRVRLVESLPVSAGAEPAWFNDQGQPFTLFLRRVGAVTFEPVPPERLLVANLEQMPSKVAGQRPRPPASLRYHWRLGRLPSPARRRGMAALDAVIDPVTARVIVAAPGLRAEVEEVRLSHACGLGDVLGAGPQDRNDASVPFDVGIADFLSVVDPFPPPRSGPEVVATLQDALLAWQAETTATRGFIVLARCDVDTAAAAPALTTRPGTELHLVAAQWRPKRAEPGVTDMIERRGYLVRVQRRYTLPAGLDLVAGAPPAANQRPGAVVLDGLLLGGPLEIGAGSVSVLRLRHCTVRGGKAPALRVAVKPDGLSLILERCVTGAVDLERPSGGGRGSLSITRSIVSAEGAPGVALAAAGFSAEICDATLLGDARMQTLEATNLIATGTLVAQRRQTGCVRYSYLGPNSLAPRRFRCQPDLDIAARAALRGVATLAPDEEAAVRLGAAPVFVDEDLDQPTAALLSLRTPDSIRSGGESGTEMGAFAAAGAPVRFANLTSLFDEYLPFALEAAILDDTRSRATAARRSAP